MEAESVLKEYERFRNKNLGGIQSVKVFIIIPTQASGFHQIQSSEFVS
jgi:hypothetical protein